MCALSKPFGKRLDVDGAFVSYIFCSYWISSVFILFSLSLFLAWFCLFIFCVSQQKLFFTLNVYRLSFGCVSHSIVLPRLDFIFTYHIAFGFSRYFSSLFMFSFLQEFAIVVRIRTIAAFPYYLKSFERKLSRFIESPFFNPFTRILTIYCIVRLLLKWIESISCIHQ